MVKEKIKMTTSGSIVVSYRDKITGVSNKVLSQKNLVTFGAADIMAKLLSGDQRYAIGGMYFEFQNTSDLELLPGESITRSSNIDYFNSPLSHSDWLRVPIVTTGKISKAPVDSVDYSGNSVTFVATTGSSTNIGEQNSYVFSHEESSKIFSLALVSIPSHSERSQDVIFSRANLSTPIAALDGSYIDIFWTISFL